MTNTGKLVLVALFLCGAFLSPVYVQAQTLEEQRVALIEQLIALLEEKVAMLIAQMEAQQKEITTLKQPVLGSVNMPEAPAPFTINVSTEFGKGSWDEFDKKCRGSVPEVIDTSYDCANDFLDGKIAFKFSEDVASIKLTYYPTSNPKEIVNTGGLIPDGEFRAGWFKPNTEYHWSITGKNKVGEEAHAEGKFTTGKY